MKVHRSFRLRRGHGAPRARWLALAASALATGLALAWLGPPSSARYRDEPTFTFSLVGNPADVSPPTRAGFVLEGGGTDIDESFAWMIDRSGGGDFLVLRTAGTDAYNPYVLDITTPEGRRADSVATLILHDRSASFDPFVIDTIRRAEAIWLSGGDQALHVGRWRGTPVVRAIEDLASRGVPIGGTSSGLAILGEYVYSAEADAPKSPNLFSSSALLEPSQPRITLRRDVLHFPILKGMLLDPHFCQESRHGRMAAFLSRMALDGWSDRPRGLGIDAWTALLVEPDGQSLVITHPEHPAGSAILFELAGPPEVCLPGRPLSARNIRLQEFRRGDRVDLAGWTGEASRTLTMAVEEGLISLNDAPEPVPTSPAGLLATSLIATQETPADAGEPLDEALEPAQ